MDIRGLTVGEVAGIINAAVVVATLTFPLLLVLFVIGLLRETNTAATWSVLGRLLNDSLWPLILGTDTVARRNVSKRVVASSLLATLGMIVLAIVSPITPLGLSTHVGSTSPKPVIFSYVPDTSPMGQATISHADYTNNRLCGAMLLLNCPGSRAGYDTTRNSTGWYANSSTLDAYMSSTIAPNITEVFTSGTNGDENTVSSVFDIAWRSFIVYGNATKPAANEKQWIDHGRSRAQGSFQYSQSFILNNRYEAIEGLIVDTISGANGFRNHTMPPSSETGFEWSETLLWIEPETICVDMNLTVDYSIPSPGQLGSVLDARLTDHGGISNITRHYPYLDLNHSQTQPLLYERAWKGAVSTNFNLMTYYNLTRNETFLGQSFKLSRGFGGVYMAPNRISASPSNPSTR